MPPNTLGKTQTLVEVSKARLIRVQEVVQGVFMANSVMNCCFAGTVSRISTKPPPNLFFFIQSVEGIDGVGVVCPTFH